jgi:Holliday junction DNA helicase RuvA
MISQVTGRLATRDVERVEITTAGGVTYELSIPLGTFEALPPRGDPVTLFTHLVVRDDEWLLYGFGSAHERAVFRRPPGRDRRGPGIGVRHAVAVQRRAPGARHRARTGTRCNRCARGARRRSSSVLDIADKLDDLAGEGHRCGSSSAPGATHARSCHCVTWLLRTLMRQG